jgi:hypothetical protein
MQAERRSRVTEERARARPRAPGVRCTLGATVWQHKHPGAGPSSWREIWSAFTGSTSRFAPRQAQHVKRLRHRLGGETRVRITRVEEIRPEQSGKHRYIVRHAR